MESTALQCIRDLPVGIAVDPSRETLYGNCEQAGCRNRVPASVRGLEAYVAHGSATGQPTPSHHLDTIPDTHWSPCGGTRRLLHLEVCHCLELPARRS